MRRVTILRGVPGSGKSFWARHNRPHASVVSANFFFTRKNEKNESVYAFNPAQLREAHGSCFRDFIRCIYAGGSEVVVDNTNLWTIELAPYIAAAEAYDYQIEIVRMDKGLSAQTLSARGLHDVPVSKISTMMWTLQKERLPQFWPRELVVTHDFDASQPAPQPT